jgi:hypothetical protein
MGKAEDGNAIVALAGMDHIESGPSRPGPGATP